MKVLAGALIALIVGFMISTVIIAVFQGAIGWGWWWAVPIGAGFVLAIVGFRLLIQHVEERTRTLDAELDDREHP